MGQLLNKGLHPAEPRFNRITGCRWHLLIRILLADARSAASLAIIADDTRGRAENAPNFTPLAFPAALSAFADLSSFGLDPVSLGTRFAHFPQATAHSLYRKG